MSTTQNTDPLTHALTAIRSLGRLPTPTPNAALVAFLSEHDHRLAPVPTPARATASGPGRPGRPGWPGRRSPRARRLLKRTRVSFLGSVAVLTQAGLGAKMALAACLTATGVAAAGAVTGVGPIPQLPAPGHSSSQVTPGTTPMPQSTPKASPTGVTPAPRPIVAPAPHHLATPAGVPTPALRHHPITSRPTSSTPSTGEKHSGTDDSTGSKGGTGDPSHSRPSQGADDGPAGSGSKPPDSAEHGDKSEHGGKPEHGGKSEHGGGHQQH
jgi:hypothetical protein